MAFEQRGDEFSYQEQKKIVKMQRLKSVKLRAKYEVHKYPVEELKELRQLEM